MTIIMIILVIIIIIIINQINVSYNSKANDRLCDINITNHSNYGINQI